jgi:FMN phosphatase YigB (HAD superfamily)
MKEVVLLFDYDGTLVDLDKQKTYEAVVAEYSSMPNHTLAEDLHKLDNELCMQGQYDRHKVFEKYMDMFEGVDIKQLCLAFWDELSRAQKIKPGCIETLETLKDDYIIACVTDSDGQGGNKLKRIESTGLDKYFDAIFIGGEGGNIQHRKGSTKYLKSVIEKLAVQTSRYVMIGDKINIDLEPAEDMRMVTILMKNKEYPGTWKIEVESLPELIKKIREIKFDD